MSDIAEFMTARYDEQQAIAQAAFDAAVERGVLPRTSSNWYAPGDDTGMPSSFELTFGPEVIMLDIAAKRRRLELLVEQRSIVEYIGDHMEQFTPAEAQAACGVQAGLEASVCLDASLFTDYPDYNPAWRVA